ncbi:unnamed protein product [Agarophyton chilense]
MQDSQPLPSVDEGIVRALYGRRILISGGTGLIGRNMVRRLQQSSANICLLSRRPSQARALFEDENENIPTVLMYDAEPDKPVSDDVLNAIGTADAIINLAGEPVEEKRWTPERKLVLFNSRVNGTRKLVNAIRKQSSKAVLVSASAVGYYGTSESRIFTEECGAGEDYLATIARSWEHAALGNAEHSRTVVLRLGVVLSNEGGALPRISAAFRAFLGGPPGGGQQWFSWVHIEDVVRLLLRASVDDKWNGIYNATAPQPVRLAEFCSELGRALGRPSWLPVPKQAIQAMMGNEAAQLILSGQQVIPKRTKENGFVFKYKDVGSALQQLTNSRDAQLLETKLN